MQSIPSPSKNEIVKIKTSWLPWFQILCIVCNHNYMTNYSYQNAHFLMQDTTTVYMYPIVVSCNKKCNTTV